MTSKKDILLLYGLIILEFIILFNSKIVVKSVIESTNLFIKNILPSLFPTMVLGLLLTKLEFYKIVPNFIKKEFNTLFNFNEVHTGIFLSSMLCGSPTSALFINESVRKGLITKNESKYLCICTIFINPLFIINMVGINIFNSYKIGIFLLLITYLINFLKAFALRNKFSIEKKDINYKKTKFINEFINSITQSVYSLLNILGFIIIFNMLISLLSNIIKNTYVTSLLNIFLEITSGLAKLSILNISTELKLLICIFSLSLGGLCILIQTYNLLNKEY